VIRPLATEVVAHHLRLFGVRDATAGDDDAPRHLTIVDGQGGDAAAAASVDARAGGVVVALDPTPAFCATFGVTSTAIDVAPPLQMILSATTGIVQQRLRTLHSAQRFAHAEGVPVVIHDSGVATWFWLPVGAGGILFVGTDLAADLVRYRQGDPAKEHARPTDPVWGIAGERPLYLFEEQIAGEDPAARHADAWAMATAHIAACHLRRPLQPMLPGNAPGAVIITGDDDQAFLEKYEEQLALLGRTPITYLLHPLTRHTGKTVRTMLGKPWIDLGVHPDALETPAEYGALLKQQCDWFRRLTGKPPVSLRNHGFLNDGYWRHLPHWLDEGVRISSNLPGLDGRVLNGSLLPARLAYGDRLTNHWSMLTAFGDGMIFALGMTDAEAGARVRDLAEKVVASGIPGIIVLNLHPQNVAETRAMHRAALDVIDDGFVAWTLRDCLNWFDAVDAGQRPREHAGITDRLRTWLHRRLRRLEPGRR
jgi:hypothetical protein